MANPRHMGISCVNCFAKTFVPQTLVTRFINVFSPVSRPNENLIGFFLVPLNGKNIDEGM
jgi:hypothetical protein